VAGGWGWGWGGGLVVGWWGFGWCVGGLSADRWCGSHAQPDAAGWQRAVKSRTLRRSERCWRKPMLRARPAPHNTRRLRDPPPPPPARLSPRTRAPTHRTRQTAHLRDGGLECVQLVLCHARVDDKQVRRRLRRHGAVERVLNGRVLCVRSGVCVCVEVCVCVSSARKSWSATGRALLGGEVSALLRFAAATAAVNAHTSTAAPQPHRTPSQARPSARAHPHTHTPTHPHTCGYSSAGTFCSEMPW
jgi:hypothetical protein